MIFTVCNRMVLIKEEVVCSSKSEKVTHFNDDDEESTHYYESTYESGVRVISESMY